MNETIAQRQITVAGLPIEYLTAGEGAPLLLLHGVGDSAQTWELIIPILARTHRVYAPSLPGFGMSAKETSDYSPEFYTSFIADFLDALELKQVAIAGNSLGGLIAMRLAFESPSRVSALVLIDSAGLGRDITLALRLLTLPGMEKLTSTLYQTKIGAKVWAYAVSSLLFANPTQVLPDWRDRLQNMARNPGYLKATVGAVRGGSTIVGQRDREILLDRLPNLAMPTLIIWGTRDRIVPAHQAHLANARLKQGQLVLLDCGHVPQLEKPESVAEVLVQFLNTTAVLSR
ncbi:alpha/beta fold hydrolase [Candidatus Gracilibacteria bacterium]|nr:alpha/beta fold hydrolase [Candidatus Gracilibacteria bacterium]NJM88769.1 alpha/beta fold hydrolase [Hydrococcus sp. RU_2_2]NJP19629.1 alpha/beta fold hydrolase [Hydrococcus sp. CRU_1_1]